MTGWMGKFCLTGSGDMYVFAGLITFSIYTIMALAGGIYQLVAGHDNWWPAFLNADALNSIFAIIVIILFVIFLIASLIKWVKDNTPRLR